MLLPLEKQTISYPLFVHAISGSAKRCRGGGMGTTTQPINMTGFNIFFFCITVIKQTVWDRITSLSQAHLNNFDTVNALSFHFECALHDIFTT